MSAKLTPKSALRKRLIGQSSRLRLGTHPASDDMKRGMGGRFLLHGGTSDRNRLWDPRAVSRESGFPAHHTKVLCFASAKVYLPYCYFLLWRQKAGGAKTGVDPSSARSGVPYFRNRSLTTVRVSKTLSRTVGDHNEIGGEAATAQYVAKANQ